MKACFIRVRKWEEPEGKCEQESERSKRERERERERTHGLARREPSLPKSNLRGEIAFVTFAVFYLLEVFKERKLFMTLAKTIRQTLFRTQRHRDYCNGVLQ